MTRVLPSLMLRVFRGERELHAERLRPHGGPRAWAAPVVPLDGMEASFPTTTSLVRGRTTVHRAGGIALAGADRRRPLVLCLHEPDHHRTWAAGIPALEEAGFRVAAPLLRGYEPSSQPIDDDYTIRMVEDVLGFIEYLSGALPASTWSGTIGGR